jgi:hypothetical protein
MLRIPRPHHPTRLAFLTAVANKQTMQLLLNVLFRVVYCRMRSSGCKYRSQGSPDGDAIVIAHKHHSPLPIGLMTFWG